MTLFKAAYTIKVNKFNRQIGWTFHYFIFNNTWMVLETKYQSWSSLSSWRVITMNVQWFTEILLILNVHILDTHNWYLIAHTLCFKTIIKNSFNYIWADICWISSFWVNLYEIFNLFCFIFKSVDLVISS